MGDGKMYATKFNPVFCKLNLLDNVTEILSHNNETDIIVPNVFNVDPKIINGFTRSIIDKWPSIQNNLYLQKHALGQNNYIEILNRKNNRLFLCQMFTDIKKRHSKKNINYAYLTQCLLQVRQRCHHAKNTHDREIQIHCPKFGTGNSGGRWSTILDLITDYWSGIPTFFYSH